MLPCDGVYGLWAPLPDTCLVTIDTDRPHQTDTPHVVPAGHAQFESAVTAVQLGGTLDGHDKTTHLVMLESAYRFGILSRVELGLLFKHADYVLDRSRFVSPGPLEARLKLVLTRENGALPAITFVPTIFVPMSNTQTLRAGGLFFLGWELPLAFDLEMNVGLLGQTGTGPHVLVVVASALTHRIAGPVSAFIDVYATGFDVQFGTGFLAPLTRDIQLDIGTYIGLNGAVYIATPFVGFSIRR